MILAQVNANEIITDNEEFTSLKPINQQYHDDKISSNGQKSSSNNQTKITNDADANQEESQNLNNDLNQPKSSIKELDNNGLMYSTNVNLQDQSGIEDPTKNQNTSASISLHFSTSISFQNESDPDHPIENTTSLDFKAKTLQNNPNILEYFIRATQSEKTDDFYKIVAFLAFLTVFTCCACSQLMVRASKESRLQLNAYYHKKKMEKNFLIQRYVKREKEDEKRYERQRLEEEL
eukprot:403367697